MVVTAVSQRKPSKPFDGYDSAAGSSSVERSSSRSSVFVSTSSPSYDGRSNQPSEITESSKGHEGGPRVFTSPEDVLASLSRGDNPEATARLGEMLGLPPEKLQATASALLTGNVQDVPSEVMHLAFERTLAANSMTAGAPAAAPASITSRGGTSRTERPTLVAPPGFYVHPQPQAAHSVNMPFKPIPSTKSELASANLALGIDDEQTQDWLYLYRGTFLKYTDVMYGSILTTMAVILFWTGILSFSVALWILPIFMVAGVRVILVGAAGIPAPMLPYSKLPAGVVLAWEVTAIATFLISMLPMLRDVWFEVYSMVLLTGLALYLKLRAFLTDPGTVPAAHPRPPPLPPMQLAAMQATNPYHCFTCGIYRPIRSKHCSACDRCVAEFDHHCPVVANCIGRNNRRHFVGYLLALATAEILWLRLALLYWKRILQTVVRENLRAVVFPPVEMSRIAPMMQDASLACGTTCTHILCATLSLNGISLGDDAW